MTLLLTHPPAIVESAPATVLKGRCSGRLMAGWANRLRARHGAGAVQQVRAELGTLGAQLPDSPAPSDWIPVAAQVRATEVLLERFHRGDPESLYRDVFADTVASLPRGARFALRGVGLRRAIRKAPSVHRRLYDVGTVDAEVARRAARLEFTDAAMFAHPTWRMLQRFAVRVLFELCGKPAPTLSGATIDGAGYELALTW